MSEGQVKCIGTLVVAIVVCVGAYVYGSYASLEPREIGILYNSIDKTVDNTTYTGGAHFVGLFNSFINFPGGYETVEFSSSVNAENDPISVRTSDGNSIEISVSFQYAIIREKLSYLYSKFNKNYMSVFVDMARDSLLKTAAMYSANEFWGIRDQISIEMLKNLNTSLYEASASVVNFQFLKVDISSDYEKKIVETQVEKQLSNTEVYKNEAALIRQSIEILSSECNQNITSINAEAEAESYYIVQVAEGAAKKRMIDVEAEIYQLTIQELQFKTKEMNEYIFLRSIEHQKNATYIVGMTDAVIQIKT